MWHHLFLLADSSCSTPLFPGGPGLYDNLCSGGQVQITAVSQILVLITNIIRILLSLAGALGVIFLIVGGIFYITSAGDPGRLKRAKDIITNVITGLVVVFLAYGIVTFVSGGLG